MPRTLCARVPEGVPAEDAAYATVAAIALHGVRLTEAGLGDVAAVVGLGLVGQLAVELLAAGGLRRASASTPTRPASSSPAPPAPSPPPTPPSSRPRPRAAPTGRGADGVARLRGRVDLRAAGHRARPWPASARSCASSATSPIESPRAPLFAKELRLVVSRSYGPGRYDPTYEQGGIDYPAGYVRWTEGRNLEEVLRLMAARPPAALAPDDPHLRPRRRRRRLRAARSAPSRRSASCCATPASTRRRARRVVRLPEPPAPPRARAAGCASASSAPAPSRAACCCRRCAATPTSSRSRPRPASRPRASRSASARRWRRRTRPRCSESPDVDAVLIATRHDTHAAYAARALRAGKHVFVEKPLALDEEELARRRGRAGRGAAACCRSASTAASRRWSCELREALGGRGPLRDDATASTPAGCRARTGRTTRQVGGGRIVGEGCHFVDVCAFLAGAPPVAAQRAGGRRRLRAARGRRRGARCGSPTARSRPIVYTAFGDPSLPKERARGARRGGRRRARRLPRA